MAKLCTRKAALNAEIYKVAANSKAVIMIKQEETGLEEGGGLVGLRTAVALFRGRTCLQVNKNPAATLYDYMQKCCLFRVNT